MREYAKKPESQSRTLDSNSKASRQAPIDVILQRYKERNIQRYVEDEELLQGKFDVAQREAFDDDEMLQGKLEPVQRKENRTGLPDDLKSGVENMSGYNMDDVKVHYNSDKPAQLQALAYTQGTDIHIAPGQEQHLPHEAWHVVQQMQGRVQPTMQMQEVNVNDNEGLEKEADAMGNTIYKKANCNKIQNENTSNIEDNQLVVTQNSITQFKDSKREQLTTPYIYRCSSNMVQRKPNHLKGFKLGGGAFDYNILEFQLKQIFRGDGAVRVNELSDDDDKIAHMGWDSILKFKIEDGKFIQFETLTNLIGKGINTIGSPRRKIDEIITRGVDTCTVIFITNSIEGASAHLDAPKLKSDSIFKIAVSVPKTMYKQGENPITAVFSLIDDRKSLEPTDKFSRAGFVRELIRYYFVRDGKRPKENGNVDLDKEKDLITELKKSTHPNDSIEIINRGSVESDPSEIIIHPEIGFMFDKDYLVIFYTYTERSHKDSIKKLSECEFEDDSSVK